jgi:hypothetical protein
MRILFRSSLMLLACLASCKNNDERRDYSPFEVDLSDRVTVAVSGGGTGAGAVRSRDQVVFIGCNVRAGVTSNGTAVCRNTFSDFGGGGTFVLDAIPAAGSVFGGWTGCTTAAGAACTLTFPNRVGVVTFNVTARFNTGE